METIILGILVLLIGYAIKNFWWIVICGIAIFVLTRVFENQELQGIVKAELIEEIAVKKKVAEKTGYSVSWDWRYGRDYYRYREVIDHYKCVFSVVYKDGRTGTIKCRKDDYKYNKLIRKK